MIRLLTSDGTPLEISTDPPSHWPFCALRQGEWVILCGAREGGKSWWLRKAALQARDTGIPFLYWELSGFYRSRRWRADPNRLLLLDDWEVSVVHQESDARLPQTARGVVAVHLSKQRVVARMQANSVRWPWPFHRDAEVVVVELSRGPWSGNPSQRASLPRLPSSWTVQKEGDLLSEMRGVGGEARYGYRYHAWPPLPEED